MKKTILKFTGVVAMAAVMMFNVQYFVGDNESGISLKFLENLAFANGESPFAEQKGKSTENIGCTKEIQISITPPAFKWVKGRRDNCTGKGDGCTPTACI